MREVNRQIVLVDRPVGIPKPSDFQLRENPLPRAGAGEALVRTLYLSLDPYMRNRASGLASYARNLQVGEVMVGNIVGEVWESNDPRLARGDIVCGPLGWQDFATAPAKSLRKIDPKLAPITTSLYVLGMPGLTAYFGLLDICRPQPGETVVVSGAAGAVGSVAGQIAKIKRCRAIGLTSTGEKVRFVTRELGFDGALNSRDATDLHARLKELCPNGVDIYFDSVGGAVSDAVMRLINTRARVSLCGQISQSNPDEPDAGPRWFGQLILRQAKVEGFLVHQFADRYEEGYRQLANWLREKRIRYREDVVEGLQNAPQAFISMLEGRHVGKPLVKVAEQAESAETARTISARG
jgi:NADPH-dependent curcumin reductase CurA